jgi:hypothetical protein
MDQGFSKVLNQPRKGHLWMKSEPTEVPSNGRDLMPLPQGENHRLENRQHLHHGNATHATAVFSSQGIPTPVEMLLHFPLGANIAQKALRWATMLGEWGQAIPNFAPGCSFDGALAAGGAQTSPISPPSGKTKP